MGKVRGRYEGRGYLAVVDRSADGRRVKLVAEELGGADYISLNLYLTTGSGPMLKPCEMPAEKVTRFVMGFEPDET